MKALVIITFVLNVLVEVVVKLFIFLAAAYGVVFMIALFRDIFSLGTVNVIQWRNIPPEPPTS
jgi:hypothetical protein